jgi:lipoyl(octanoyl) transferase
MPDTHAPRWRILHSPPLDAATNMATDVALMRRARETGEWVLRVYGWESPTLSLGRNQPARGHYDEARAARDRIAIVRRPTGGRALLHWREVTYSVTAPVDGAGSLRESYARINALLLDGLRRLGVPARLSGDARPAPGPSLAPCFAEPVVGEIVAEGRKLVGSAQWRDAGALLQHGSVLVDDDQPLVAALTLEAVTPPPPPATLRELLGRAPSVDEVAEAMWAAVLAGEDPCATRVTIGPPLDEWVSDARGRFIDPAWTWRR